MSLDSQIIEEMNDNSEEDKKRIEAELQKDIYIGEEYFAMKQTSGWKRLERAILDRTSSLSSRLLTVSGEKDLYRLQGELLGIQSILNIIDVAIELAEESKKQIKENSNNG